MTTNNEFEKKFTPPIGVEYIPEHNFYAWVNGKHHGLISQNYNDKWITWQAATTEANKRMAELQASNKTLCEAGQALIDRWDSPKWVDNEHTGVFIDALRKALAATPDESLQAFENEHYRDAILEVKRQIESNRVWSGMKYTYTPMPEFKQIRCIEAIDAALKEVK